MKRGEVLWTKTNRVCIVIQDLTVSNAFSLCRNPKICTENITKYKLTMKFVRFYRNPTLCIKRYMYYCLSLLWHEIYYRVVTDIVASEKVLYSVGCTLETNTLLC